MLDKFFMLLSIATPRGKK